MNKIHYDLLSIVKAIVKLVDRIWFADIRKVTTLLALRRVTEDTR